MTMSEGELRQLFHEAWSLPRGPARFAALDAVFRHADAAGQEEFAFEARLGSIEDFHNGGDPTRAFLAFSWCLDFTDRPDHTSSDGGGRHRSRSQRTLLWAFKWVAWSLPQFPEIPLDRTHAVLDDMQRRYQLGGHSLHAVYQHRLIVDQHVGDADAAAHWYQQLISARRDGLSDCRACVPSTQVRYLSWVGRDEEAIEIGRPFLHGGCTEQPQWMLSELLQPFLRTGDTAGAVDAYTRGYARMRDNRHHLENIAEHVLFCGLTGNEARGLEMIEHHLPWLDRPPTPFAAMEFLSASAVVLRRLRETGHGGLTVRRVPDAGTELVESTVDELHTDVVAQATALAARFDARNANAFQTTRTAARMALEPLVGSLALSTAGSAGSGRRRWFRRA